MDAHVRLARLDDRQRVQEIERRAGERFREIGMDDVADDDPPSDETLAAYIVAGRAWVAVDRSDRPLDQMERWKREKQEGATDKEALLDFTRDELHEKAEDADIEGRSDMNKDELAEALSSG